MMHVPINIRYQEKVVHQVGFSLHDHVDTHGQQHIKKYFLYAKTQYEGTLKSNDS